MESVTYLSSELFFFLMLKPEKDSLKLKVPSMYFKFLSDHNLYIFKICVDPPLEIQQSDILKR